MGAETRACFARGGSSPPTPRLTRPHSHSYSYGTHQFQDAIPSGSKIVKIFSYAKGALGCSSAVAEVLVNGVSVGKHGSTGTCAFVHRPQNPASASMGPTVLHCLGSLRTSLHGIALQM